VAITGPEPEPRAAVQPHGEAAGTAGQLAGIAASLTALGLGQPELMPVAYSTASGLVEGGWDVAEGRVEEGGKKALGAGMNAAASYYMSDEMRKAAEQAAAKKALEAAMLGQ
jgi:hypothetical protein